MEEQDFCQLIKTRIQKSIEVKVKLMDDIVIIGEIARLIIDAYHKGKKVVLFGNGGSAADAQHIAAELAGQYYMDRKPLPAEALTVNTSTITAIGNDYGFERVFARQVEALGNPGDIAIGISTSGNSPNVIEGIRVAKQKGMIAIGLTGADGGQLKNEADYCICVPSKDTPRIQEAHILIGHIWCELIERALFGNEGKED